MAVVSRGFMACFLCAFSLVAWADDFVLDEKEKDRIINIAYTKAMATIEELNKRIGQCEKLEQETILSPALLQSLPLTDQQIRTVLVYFRLLSSEKCEGVELWEKAYMEFSRFKYIEAFYKGKNVIDTGFYDLEVLCCIGSRSRFETTWRYMKIPLEIRKKLEQIPELQRPFNLIKAVDSMGLSDSKEEK